MVIGITGLLNSGKSRAAQVLVEEFGFTLIKFADPLKDMLRAIGLSEEEIEGSLKEAPCEKLLGKTPRFAMQTLGTEWGRNIIGSSFWVSLWQQRVLKYVNNFQHVVSDDCRFPQEEDLIRMYGGEIWKIERPRIELSSTHESEAGQSKIRYDRVIVNDRTLDLFKQSVRIKAISLL